MWCLFDSDLFNDQLFWPRDDDSPPPPGAHDRMVTVAPGVALHLRFHRRPGTRGACLLFHGNGEIVADYDPIADDFAAAGLDLVVVDYRGYGASGGRPTLRALIADSDPVFAAFHQEIGDRPSLIMGRSLGGIAAAFLSASALPGVRGLIFESAAADLIGLVRRRGIPDAMISEVDRQDFDPNRRARQATLPSLVLHGERDDLIVPEVAETLYRELGSAEKRLVWVPRRGHNDLSQSPVYWAALTRFAAEHLPD